MRHAGTVFLVSAAVHAAVVVGIGTRPHRPRPIDVGPPPTITVVDVIRPNPAAAAIPPIEVVLLDDRPTPARRAAPERATAPGPARAPRAPPGIGAVASTTGAETTGAGVTGSTTDGAPGPPGARSNNPWFDMRKGRPVRLTFDVPTPRRDGRAHAPEALGPDVDSGQLVPSGRGTYRSDQGPFTARVASDGSVTLSDKRNLQVRFALPGPGAIGRSIASWYEDPNKPVGTVPPSTYKRPPRLPRDEATGEDSRPDHGQTVPIVGGSFDVTDALMRAAGIDPYASKKLAFLDSTRAQRVQIGKRHRQRQLAQAPQMMKRHLERAWATFADPVPLRETLFELWDECAETGTDDLVTAGRQARALVIGFIRARLPAGSATAYTPAELARLNKRRRSKATFAPY